MKLYTRDWLDNKELRRCSPNARAVLIDLMALAHEGAVYGHLSDKIGPLSTQFMAARCVLSISKLRHAMKELLDCGRIASTEDGNLFIPRMVEDEKIRLSRASGGHLGGNPNLTKKVNLEGYPSPKGEGNLRPDSESDSDSSKNSKNTEKPSTRARAVSDEREAWFAEVWEIYWRHIAKAAALKAYLKHVEDEQVRVNVRLAVIAQRPAMLAREPDKRPHFSTWLNQHRWEDEIEEPSKTKSKLDLAFEEAFGRQVV